MILFPTELKKDIRKGYQEAHKYFSNESIRVMEIMLEKNF